MKYKAYWKIEPEFEIKEIEELDEVIHNKLMDITMNPHDYIDFEEVKDE